MKQPINPDVLQAWEAVERARKTLRLVCQGKLPPLEAKIIHDLLGPGSERARSYAALPEFADWQREFNQAADNMDAVRGEARKLFTPRKPILKL